MSRDGVLGILWNIAATKREKPRFYLTGNCWLIYLTSSFGLFFFACLSSSFGPFSVSSRASLALFVVVVYGDDNDNDEGECFKIVR